MKLWFGWHQRSDPRLLQSSDSFRVNHWVGGAVGVVRDENGGVPKWDELLKCKCDIDATLQELMDIYVDGELLAEVLDLDRMKPRHAFLGSTNLGSSPIGMDALFTRPD